MHFLFFQLAEVFEFEGNVYSHHLSPIAKKHTLIAGVCVCECENSPGVPESLVM